MISLPDSILEDYQFNRELKSDGPGYCYLLMDKITSLPVTCKILNRESIGSLDEQARFLTITKKISELGYPFLIPYTGFYETDQHYFLIRSFYIKSSLSESIINLGVQNESTYSILFSRLLEIILKLHECGIQNFSLHPNNIIMQDENTPLIADIYPIDNGLANCAKGLSNWRMAYIPPEVYQHKGPDSLVKADEWSLACIYYFVMTGKVPFPISNSMQLTRALQTAPIASYIPCQNTFLTSLLDVALISNPNDRAGIQQLISMISHHHISSSTKVNSPQFAQSVKDSHLPIMKTCAAISLVRSQTPIKMRSRLSFDSNTPPPFH